MWGQDQRWGAIEKEAPQYNPGAEGEHKSLLQSETIPAKRGGLDCSQGAKSGMEGAHQGIF